MSKYASLFDNMTKPSLFPTETNKPSLFGDSNTNPMMQKAVDWIAKTGNKISAPRILYALGSPSALTVNDLYKVGEVHLNNAKSLNKLCDDLMLELDTVNRLVGAFERGITASLNGFADTLATKKESLLSRFWKSGDKTKPDSNFYLDKLDAFDSDRENLEKWHITPVLDKVRAAISSAAYTILGLDELYISLLFLKDNVEPEDKDVVNKKIVSTTNITVLAKLSKSQLESIVNTYTEKSTFYENVSTVIIPLVRRIETWKKIPNRDLSNEINELKKLIGATV